MEHTFIAWNLENWVTVLLMAVAGYLLFTVIVQTMRKYQGG